jgi:hypothetical protein
MVTGKQASLYFVIFGLQKLEKQAFPFTNLPLYILKIIEDDLQLP